MINKHNLLIKEVIQEPKSENEGSISDSVVLHKILSRNSNADVVYLKVDFEKKIKKDTYRKINKVLGEK